MRIGIGITTTLNREVNIEDYKKYLSGEYEYYFNVSIDIELKGVAQNRNKILKDAFDNGCDCLFLFDDDCYPIMYNFDKYIVEQVLENKIEALFLPNSFSSKMLFFNDEITSWDSYLGCFTFITKEIIQNVGYYNTKYNKYGYEDIGYHNRIKRYLSKKKNKQYLSSLLRIPYYIKSEDLYHLNPNPNFTFEQKKVMIDENHKFFLEEIENCDKDLYYIPYYENF